MHGPPEISYVLVKGIAFIVATTIANQGFRDREKIMIGSEQIQKCTTQNLRDAGSEWFPALERSAGAIYPSAKINGPGLDAIGTPSGDE